MQQDSIEKLSRSGRGSFSIGYAGLALLIAAIYTVLVWITPTAIDDWTFWGSWRDDIPGEGFSLSKWWGFFQFIRAYDNGRLSNVMDPIFVIYSPWKEIFPFLTGILMAWAVVLSQRLATRGPSCLWLAATWTLMIVCLPWRDTLFVTDYALNYIWSAAITLSLFFFMRFGERLRKPWLFILTLLLALIAGGWHESFAMASLCGLALLMLARRFRLSRRFYAVFAVYLASTLLFMLSPGMIGRIGNTAGLRPHHLPFHFHLIIFLLGVTILGSLFSKRGRAVLREAAVSDVAVVSFGIFVAGNLIASLTVNTMRAYFWPNLAGVVLTLWIVKRWFAQPAKSWMPNAVATLLACACTAEMVLVIVWQWRYSKDYENIITLLNKSENGSVYYDFPYPDIAPAYTLRVPTSHMWINWYNYHALLSWYMTPVIGVAPTALRDATLDQGEPVRGRRFSRGKVTGTVEGTLYKGHIITPYEQIDTTILLKRPFGPFAAELVLPDRVVRAEYVSIPFITERGDTLLYYRVWP